MKAVLITMALAAASVSSHAQGTLNFANYGAGVDAPVINWDGTRLAGWLFVADLWWAPGLVTDPKQLIELGQPVVFLTNGYFLGGTRTIPGAGQGTVITVQIRAFGGTPGCPPICFDCYCPTFQQGYSDLFQVTLTTPPNPPASLNGMAPFSLSPPTTYSAPQFILNAITGDKLVLAWAPSAVATNFVLQQNADLTTTNWVTLTQRPVLVGPQFQVEMPKPAGTMFYRLVSEP